MTAVVLARGAGQRMRDAAGGAVLTPAQALAARRGRKAMMPLGVGPHARPFLDFVLASLTSAGCSRVCLVIAPDHDDVRRRYTVDRPPSQLELVFAVQHEPSGTAQAVLAAEDAVAGEPFLVVNADNLYPVPVMHGLATLDGPGLPAFASDDLVRTSNIPPERVASFAVIDVDAGGWLRRIVEKPDGAVLSAYGPAALISMNAWRFDSRIFDACRDVPISPRGEYELPQAVGLAVSRGVKFRVFRSNGPVLDLTRPYDIPEVSRRVADLEPTW